MRIRFLLVLFVMPLVCACGGSNDSADKSESPSASTPEPAASSKVEGAGNDREESAAAQAAREAGSEGDNKQHHEAYRTWTDSSGTFTVEAEFVGLNDGKVRLKKRDGKVIAVALSQLSEEGQDFVKRSVSESTGDAASPNEPATEMTDALYPIKQDGKWGYIDAHGRIVVKPQFDYAYKFSEGLGAVRADGDLHGYVNTAGVLVIKPRFHGSQSFSEGLALVSVGEDRKYGFIDKTGKFVIEPQFDGGAGFSEGLAMVQASGGFGFIDKTGKMVIAPESVFIFGGFFGGYALVNKGGSLRLPGGLTGGETYLIDRAGKRVVFEQEFESVGHLREGLIRVELDGKYGYADRTGKIVIQPQFEVACDFHEGLAGVKISGKWGFANAAGDVVVDPVYDEGEHFSEGLARVERGDEQAYIDKSGKIVFSLRPGESGDSFTNGLARVTVDDKIRYVDKSGQYVWPPAE